MMTNMKTVLCTDESRVLPNDTDGLTKGWVFNDDNYTVGIWRQKSGLVIIISGRMIGNELTSLFREPEELNCPLTCIAHLWRIQLSHSLGNLLLAQTKKVILCDHVHA